MTESKKKTTKKEVVEKSEATTKPAKRTRTKESKVIIKDETETLIQDEVTVDISGVTEVTEKTEDAIEPASVEIAEEEPEVHKEKKHKKAEHEQETKAKTEVRTFATAEEFDWDSFESEEQRSSPKYKEFESLYDETLSTVAVDEVVIGTVIQMTSREVVINIGYKSEGVVSLNEFRYNPNLKIGDKVEVYVESQEDKKGQLLLSHKKARLLKQGMKAFEKISIKQ